MRYCLDTNIIIDLWKGDEKIRKIVSAIDPEDLYITPITLCELYRGAYGSSRPTIDLALIGELLSSVSLLNFSPESCRLFGEKFVNLRKTGKTPQEPDLMIASIAMAHGLTVATRNKKHFETLGTEIETW